MTTLSRMLERAEVFSVQLASAQLNRRGCLERAFASLPPLEPLSNATDRHESLSVKEGEWATFLRHRAVDPLMHDMQRHATEVQAHMKNLKETLQKTEALRAMLSEKEAAFREREEGGQRLASDTGRDDAATAALRIDVERDQLAHVRVLSGAGEHLNGAFAEVLLDDFSNETQRVQEDVCRFENEWRTKHAEACVALEAGRWQGVPIDHVFGLLGQETAQELHSACVQRASEIRVALSARSDELHRASEGFEERAARIVQFVHVRGAELCFLDALSNVYFEMVVHHKAQSPSEACSLFATRTDESRRWAEANHRGDAGVSEGRQRICALHPAPAAGARFRASIDDPLRWNPPVPCDPLPPLRLAALHLVRV